MNSRKCTFEYSLGSMGTGKNPSDVMIRVKLLSPNLYFISGSNGSGY